ncbi:hypothetical protein GWO43_25550 [candidate division KSB1 bacterium]|nr:hypothetical protein [candidate division KSB1 bacterium]NIR69001.1 hypothetical protein [candidate division KSB1 bacterium]NIS27298.1 hypothetical protein [candidate division KSB1 bacterium]NIT74177.1 hypothetical protein [candidate division KSB1 bacterium]NIU28028.1 hypothetical protein [candidate division KSB1 bacterium]
MSLVFKMNRAVHPQRFKNAYLYGLLISTLMWFCSDDDNPVQMETTVVPEVTSLIAPSIIYNASPKKHTVSVKVTDPQGLEDIESVRYEIDKSGSATPSTQGELRDEGKAGDIIPNDGTYATQIDGSFAQNDSGKFNLSVTARDLSGNVSNVDTAVILVRSGTENLPPEISAVQLPKRVAVDSLFEFVMTADVSDPEGLSDVQKVTYQLFPPAHPNPTLTGQMLDNGQSGDTTAGDGTYSAELSTDLFTEAADYFFRFQAEDERGNKSPPKVASIRGFFIGNRAPVISNLVAPDTVRINPDQVTRILITIDVTDPQGLSDIDFVRFRSFLPNGNEASNSPFELSDDGNTVATGDEIAGDGTYSIVINLPPTGVQPGDFRFVFQAKDKSDAFSNVIEHIMTVVE